MPIHDVGYRSWKGKLTATWSRWWTISEVGVRSALGSRWIRRIILASWFPVIYFGVIFFGFESVMETSFQDLARQASGRSGAMIQEELQSLDFGADGAGEGSANEMVREIEKEVGDRVNKTAIGRNPMIEMLPKNNVAGQVIFERIPMIEMLPNSEVLLEALNSGDVSNIRWTVWGYLLSTFLRYSQGMVTLMIVGLVVPPLISRDVRSRAFLLYYSRPITRLEYLMGKVAIPGVILSLVTLLPGLILYFVALMLSPDLTVVADTWDLPMKVILATAACIIPTCLVGLLFSSLTQESRFAGFAWFTVWGLGAVVWFGIYMTNSNGGTVPFDSKWSLISIYSTIGRVQSWIFGLEMNVEQVIPSIVTLALISIVSFVLLYRRVSAPIRV